MNKGIIFGVVILLVLLLIGGRVYYSNNEIADVKNGVSGNVVKDVMNTRVISISADNFAYTPELIIVKKGERVKIVVDNVDTTHGIAILELGIKGIDSVEFTADKVGTYEFRCPTFCGSGHREMKGTLIVEE